MIALDLLVIVPVLCAVVSAFSGRWPSVPRWFGLLGPVSQSVLLIWLAADGVLSGERVEGIRGSQVWATSTDGLSTPLLALTAAIGLLAISASWEVAHRPGAHFALLALLQAAVAGVFLADNLILFYIAWESVLVPMFLLIGGWGSANARKAAMKFLVFTFAGGAVLLLGIILALVMAGTASIPALTGSASANQHQTLLFWLFAAAFLVKVPAVGLHTWLPDAHTEAPTAGSIVLAGLLLKMGGYGLIRVAGPLAPRGLEQGAWILGVLGVLGIVWGAATALVQSDLKRLIAYSSVAHMGFVLLAVSVGTPAALSAAVMTMVSHGLVAGVLFYLVGALYHRSHTRELQSFGGLGDVIPRWSTAFVFSALASAGLPALSGFPGEFVTLLEGFRVYGWWMLVVGVGIVLAAAYNLRAVRETVQGADTPTVGIDDLGRGESLATVLSCAGIFLLGVAPWLVTRPATAALEALAALTERGVL